MSTASFCMSSFMSALFMITFLAGLDPEEDFRSSAEEISGATSAPPLPLFESSLIFHSLFLK
ncbi:UNVERIFIED_CONTAM: hypothetical protein Sradi_2762800 [Sesamum radiatum]|uniref:Uncharacterized protein n=1 Tax=Sesamum radiatum TaxID=300843 RepID=A0AAW2S8E0_SESRA